MRRYLEVSIFWIVFIISFLFFYKGFTFKEDPNIILTSLLSFVSSLLLTFFICWILSAFNPSVPKGHNTTSWTMSIAFSNNYFKYKDNWYMTYLDSDKNEIEIYKVTFMRFVICGKMRNHDNRNTYRACLVNILDEYIKKDIDNKLFIRNSKNKFKDYNSDLG